LEDGRDAPEKDDTIRVVDRRRFTEDGELRPGWEPPEPAPPETAEEAPAEGAPAGTPPPRSAPVDHGPSPAASAPQGATSPLFLDLVNDLAQQAALFLEGSQGFPAQPAQAQRLIDYLGVLETKTRGNLSAEESQILSNIVFQLRALFVQKNK
jgi:hypothetical protein